MKLENHRLSNEKSLKIWAIDRQRRKERGREKIYKVETALEDEDVDAIRKRPRLDSRVLVILTNFTKIKKKDNRDNDKSKSIRMQVVDDETTNKSGFRIKLNPFQLLYF